MAWTEAEFFPERTHVASVGHSRQEASSSVEGGREAEVGSCRMSKCTQQDGVEKRAPGIQQVPVS